MKKFILFAAALLLLAATAITAGASESPNPAVTDATETVGDERFVYVTASVRGVLGQTKDGDLAAHLPVAVDPDQTFADYYISRAHELYSQAGADGYETVQGSFGPEIVTLWGETDGVGAFLVNGDMLNSTADVTKIKGGDEITLIVYRDDWSDNIARLVVTGAMPGEPGSGGLVMTFAAEMATYDENFELQWQMLVGANIVNAKTGELIATTDENGETEQLTVSEPVMLTLKSSEYPLVAAVLDTGVFIDSYMTNNGSLERVETTSGASHVPSATPSETEEQSGLSWWWIVLIAIFGGVVGYVGSRTARKRRKK